MKPSIFVFLIPIFLLSTLYGCAPRYPVATPYHKTPRPPLNQPEEMPPPAPSTAPGSNPLSEKIRARASALLHNGHPDAAAQVLERGLRIAPKDGHLWSQLAEVRLRQGRRHQALALAKKSNSMAHGDLVLRQKNQQIMNQAKDQHR